MVEEISSKLELVWMGGSYCPAAASSEGSCVCVCEVCSLGDCDENLDCGISGGFEWKVDVGCIHLGEGGVFGSTSWFCGICDEPQPVRGGIGGR